MFDYRISKHPHFNEACRAFAIRHNMAKLAERAGMNVQTLRNKLNPEQPHQLTAPDIWLLTDLTEDSTLVDGFLAQIHCLPCVPTNEVAREKMPQYVLKATAEIGRVAASAVSGVQLNATTRRQVVESVNSVSLRLSAEVHSAPLVALKDAELTAGNRGRRNDDTPGAVTILRAFCRVISDPDLTPAKRTQGQRLKIFPDLPAVHHAGLQLGQREHGREIIKKFAHQQVLVFVRAVFQSQLVQVEQVTAAAHGILYRHDLPELTISTQQARRQRGVGQIDIDTVRF